MIRGMIRGAENLHISTGWELDLEPKLYRPCALPTELTWLWPPWADWVWFGYDSGMIRVVVVVVVIVVVVVVLVVVVVAAAARRSSSSSSRRRRRSSSSSSSRSSRRRRRGRGGSGGSGGSGGLGFGGGSGRGSSGGSSGSSNNSKVWGVIRRYGLGVWFGGMIRGMIRGYDSGVWFVHVEPFSLLKPWTHNKWKGPYVSQEK